MKTTPLPEILKQITPLPWESVPIKHHFRDSVTTHHEIQGGGITLVAHTPLESVNPAGFKRRKRNAAYLAHAANLLPGLVEALREVPDTLETLADDSEEAGWGARARNARKLAKSIRQALARATSVLANS